MTETSIIAIILGLIAVGGTLVGTWLGRVLERNDETKKWRREQCLGAYSKVLNSCHIVSFEADAVYGMECGSSEYVKQQEILLSKVADMYYAVDKIVLIGSKEVHEKFQDLTTYYGNTIAAKSFKCPKISNSEWRKVRIDDSVFLFTECIMAARNDLGLFPKVYKSIMKVEKS